MNCSRKAYCAFGQGFEDADEDLQKAYHGDVRWEQRCICVGFHW
jgi:hypothetical protein